MPEQSVGLMTTPEQKGRRRNRALEHIMEKDYFSSPCQRHGEVILPIPIISQWLEPLQIASLSSTRRQIHCETNLDVVELWRGRKSEMSARSPGQMPGWLLLTRPPLESMSQGPELWGLSIMLGFRTIVPEDLLYSKSGTSKSILGVTGTFGMINWTYRHSKPHLRSHVQRGNKGFSTLHVYSTDPGGLGAKGSHHDSEWLFVKCSSL